MRICIFTSVCEEDAGFIDQYLEEVEYLDLPFAMHFDRCSRSTKLKVESSARCIGTTSRDDPGVEFTEQHKQDVFDLVAREGYEYAIALDVDETFDRLLTEWPSDSLLEASDLIDVRWLNLWGDEDHIRVDSEFAEGHRVKFYNLTGGRKWVFDHPITNGAKLKGNRQCVVNKTGLVCLHHGMMTPELRRAHKARWDRIYSTALRGDPNPYGFWKHALETESRAVLVRHGY